LNLIGLERSEGISMNPIVECSVQRTDETSKHQRDVRNHIRIYVYGINRINKISNQVAALQAYRIFTKALLDCFGTASILLKNHNIGMTLEFLILHIGLPAS